MKRRKKDKKEVMKEFKEILSSFKVNAWIDLASVSCKHINWPRLESLERAGYIKILNINDTLTFIYRYPWRERFKYNRHIEEIRDNMNEIYIDSTEEIPWKKLFDLKGHTIWYYNHIAAGRIYQVSTLDHEPLAKFGYKNLQSLMLQNIEEWKKPRK